MKSLGLGNGYTDIKFRNDTKCGARYCSCEAVYDEALLDGHLIGRYWSACGQIIPELSLSDSGFISSIKDFSLDSFSLSIGGKIISGWKYAESGLRNASGKSEVGVFILETDECPISVRVCTKLDGSEFIERWLEITNMGSSSLPITSVYPMSGRLWLHNHIRGTEKYSYPAEEVMSPEEGSPFIAAYNHSSGWGKEGDIWFEPLKPGETSYNGGINGKSGWSRPAFWLRNLLNGHTFVCEYAWSGNWEMKFNYDDSPEHTQAGFAIGMPEITGEAIRVLSPGETVITPAVHFALFLGNDDEIVQSLHRHVRDSVMPAYPAGRENEIEANQRGYMRDSETLDGVLTDIDVAHEAGAETYLFDAGWSGTKPPNDWWYTAGDWIPGPWLPGGLAPITDRLHSYGMKFGLWVEFEAIGSTSTLMEKHPDWVMKRCGVPVYCGRALDLSKPEVEDYLEKELSRIITSYGLDTLRIDHNNNLEIGGTIERDGFCENVMWRYYEALYRIFDSLRKKFPDVVFQNCAGGGGRLDLGILQRFHNTDISDWMRQPRGTKILNGITMVLPPDKCLRAFGVESGDHVMESDIDFQMRYIYICHPNMRGIAPNVDSFNPCLKQRINNNLQLFKNLIRPLMRDCLVYHHTPWLPLRKSAEWCVFEYSAPDKTKSLAAVFRLSYSRNDFYILYPKGIDRSKKYKVSFCSSGETAEASGYELVNNGLRLYMPGSLTSELIIFEAE
ncbi:MAG: glycoside hydrolase family 36 protein [Oscillospiraceae bacterium]|nr:glycoside hydrolase family 36 protein [Oscillospiraceae bacterium]